MRTLLLLLLYVCAFSAYGQKQIIKQFVGGIDHRTAKICIHQVKQSACFRTAAKNFNFPDYQLCMKKVLKRIPDCQQLLKFFVLTDGGILHHIRHYRHIDVILADYVYIADQGTGYFLVMPNGQFLTLPLNIPRKMLRAAPGFAEIARQYPRVGAWQIMGFPKAMRLSSTRYRLIFTQELKDGCNACRIAGQAAVAYDFSPDGKQFLGIQVLQLSDIGSDTRRRPR